MDCRDAVKNLYPQIKTTLEAQQLIDCYDKLEIEDKIRLLEIFLRTLKTSFFDMVDYDNPRAIQLAKQRKNELREEDQDQFKKYTPSFVKYEQSKNLREENENFHDTRKVEDFVKNQVMAKQNNWVNEDDDFTNLSVRERLKLIEERKDNQNIKINLIEKEREHSIPQTWFIQLNDDKQEHPVKIKKIKVDSELGLMMTDFMTKTYLENEIPNLFNGLIIFLQSSFDFGKKGKVADALRSLHFWLANENEIYQKQLQDSGKSI